MKPHTAVAPATGGCQDRAPAGETESFMHTTSDDGTCSPGIAWQYGQVDRAFATARSENRPLFLFWSAEWCPDCAQIKATIFSRRELIDRTRAFLPIYLDGDTDQAQRLGERFGAFVYPTTIIFAPDGTEITRLANAIDIQQYGRALDTAHSMMTPVRELLRRLLSDTDKGLGPDECRLLAYYNWDQDKQLTLSNMDPVRLFSTMAQACPETMPVERSRLYAEHLRAMLKTGVIPDADQEQTAQRLQTMLADPDMRLANLDLIINRPGETLAGLSPANWSGRQDLEAAWQLALDALEATPGLSVTERTCITRGRVRIVRAYDSRAVLPPELLEQALIQARWVDENTQGYERQSAINAVANTLIEAGQYDQAIAILSRELEKTTAPFYFMNKLSIASRKAGQTRQALAWLERAHAEASGPATRFQWGVNLLIGLVNLAPDEADAIEQTAVSLIKELGKSVEPLYNRNISQLRRLDEIISQWNESNAHAESLQHIRAALTGVCDSLQENQAVPLLCQEFLAG